MNAFIYLQHCTFSYQYGRVYLMSDILIKIILIVTSILSQKFIMKNKFSACFSTLPTLRPNGYLWWGPMSVTQKLPPLTQWAAYCRHTGKNSVSRTELCACRSICWSHEHQCNSTWKWGIWVMNSISRDPDGCASWRDCHLYKKRRIHQNASFLPLLAMWVQTEQEGTYKSERQHIPKLMVPTFSHQIGIDKTNDCWESGVFCYP